MEKRFSESIRSRIKKRGYKMILSQIILNQTDIVNYKLYNRYKIKQFVWCYFTDNKKREFQFDIQYNNENMIIIILSECSPIRTNQYPEINMREMNDDFFDNNLFEFIVTFCPTKRCRTTNKRITIKNDEEIKNKIQNKLLQYNLQGEQIYVISRPKSIEYIKKQKGGNKIRRTYVTCTGIIKSSNKRDTIKLIQSGIGSGKSDGFGMIKIIPIVN